MSRPDPLPTSLRPFAFRSLPLRLLALVAALTLAGAPAFAGAGSSSLHERLLERSNEARADEGLPALSADEGLARAAAGHAEELAARGVLSHDSTDPARRTPGLRVAAAGVALVEIGENLAMIEGGDVAERTIEGWLESPGHRDNLLNETYDSVGHGTAEADGVTYVVQVLGARPLTRTDLTVSVAEGSPEDASPGDAVHVEIRYEEGDLPLVLFVDGEHRPDAAAGGGMLRTRLPLPDAPVRVSVGIEEGDGRTVRILEEFTLRPGPPPELDPGAPLTRTPEGAADAE